MRKNGIKKLEGGLVYVIFVVQTNIKEIMETFWTIIWIVGVTVALFLFYCGGWWPRTWFRGFLFILLSFAFLPIVTFPIQWWVWGYCHNGVIEGGAVYDPHESGYCGD